MSKDQYKSGIDSIVAENKSANALGGSMAGNAKDICKGDASGREKVAKAELKAVYKPSEDTRYRVFVARADARYAVAQEKCDDKSGNVQRRLRQGSQAGGSCAQGWRKSADEGRQCQRKAAAASAKANSKADNVGIDARNDAVADKREADYTVAKEKCDAFASNAKTNCMNEAKLRFGKT